MPPGNAFQTAPAPGAVAIAYRDYFREIERHWSWRWDRQIIVSSVEFVAVESWYQAGVPLAVVLRAIDVFVAQKRRASRKRPCYLTYLGDTVAKVLREYDSLRQGQGDDDEAGQLNGKVARLVAVLAKLGQAYPEERAFLERLAAELTAIELGKVAAYEDLAVQLDALDDALLARFRQRLTAGESAEIREDAACVVTEEEDAAFYAKLINEAVRSHFGLCRITLLG